MQGLKYVSGSPAWWFLTSGNIYSYTHGHKDIHNTHNWSWHGTRNDRNMNTANLLLVIVLTFS